MDIKYLFLNQYDIIFFISVPFSLVDTSPGYRLSVLNLHVGRGYGNFLGTQKIVTIIAPMDVGFDKHASCAALVAACTAPSIPFRLRAQYYSEDDHTNAFQTSTLSYQHHPTHQSNKHRLEL